MTLFMWLYKFTSMPLGYVCVHRSRAQNLLYLCACFVCVAWFRNYMHSSIVTVVTKDADFYRCMHDIAGCHA